MKQVPVSEGCVATVDDEDYERVIQHKWRVQRVGRNAYAYTSISGKQVLMHRLIVNAEKGTMIDHADGNGLNNQKSNLRPCTYAQNFANARPKQTKNKTSEYKGIWFIQTVPCRRCWRAAITAEGKRLNIGTFMTEVEAARAYDAAAKALHGEFARLNFPEPKQDAGHVPTDPPSTSIHERRPAGKCLKVFDAGQTVAPRAADGGGVDAGGPRGTADGCAIDSMVESRNMEGMADDLTSGQKAARTRKLRAAGKKAAQTRKRRAAGRKAAVTRAARAASRT
jgi:hypothetical protein